MPGNDEADDEIFYEISKIILEKKDPLMLEYLNKIIRVNENIISSIEKNNGKAYNEKAEALKIKNKKIRELMKN